MYCFGDSLFKMVFRPVLTTILQETELISIWDRRAAGDNAWFLIGQIVFYWLVIIIVEHSTHIKKITNLFLQKRLIKPKNALKEDEDVIEERNRTNKMDIKDKNTAV